jgi:hypothetical protein
MMVMMVSMVIIIIVIDESNDDDHSDACLCSYYCIGCQRSDQRHLRAQRAADLFWRN